MRKSKGVPTYSKVIAEDLRGKEKFPKGSVGNTPPCGTVKRCFFVSVIVKVKSSKERALMVKLSSLMMGLVGFK